MPIHTASPDCGCEPARDGLCDVKITRRWAMAGSSDELAGCHHSMVTGPCARGGRQMASIKGVMLIPLAAESYRHHVAHNAFLGMLNSGTKTSDSMLERPRASTSHWFPARHCKNDCRWNRQRTRYESVGTQPGLSILSHIGLLRLPCRKISMRSRDNCGGRKK